jgi:hypothetical protein
LFSAFVFAHSGRSCGGVPVTVSPGKEPYDGDIVDVDDEVTDGEFAV